MPNHHRFGKRHVLALWLFTGFINVYILRVSINVAIVCMVASDRQIANALSDNETCPILDKDESGTPTQQGEFDWDHTTQGIILSSFYYGYICTQFIGGYLVRVTGARFLYGIGVGGTAALTLLTPIAARSSKEFLIVLRIFEGLLEGVTFPSSHYILGNWVPKQERSLLVSFPLSGPNLGTVLAAPLTGLLCDYGFDGGWAASFYIFGAIALLWTFGWFCCVRDTPAMHPTISVEERNYIEKNCESTAKRVPISAVPWKKIALSPPVWGVIIAHTTYNWNFYTLLTEISTYLKDVLHVGKSMNGIVTSIPYICLFIVQLLSSFWADSLRAKGVQTKIVRKSFFSIGLTLSAVFLVAISYVGCDISIVIGLLCLSVGVCGLSLSGFCVNHVDIAPQYASILMGLTNTFATVPGIVSPILTGAMLNQGSTISAWRSVFFLSGVMSIVGAVAFAILGDGKVQPWAKVSRSEASRGMFSNAAYDNDSSEEDTFALIGRREGVDISAAES